MMHAIVPLAIWGFVAALLYQAISWIVQNRRHAANAAKLHCQDAVEHPDCGFMGFKLLKAMGNADRQQLFPDFMIKRQREMSRITGRNCATYKQSLLGQTMYVTSDPKNIQALLATQFEDFDLGSPRRGNMGQTLGDGIFVQDGKAWEHSRAMLRPNYLRNQVSDLDLEERHVQNLLKVMKAGSDGWTPEIDIQTLFFRLTIDSATEFLFGESVDSQINEAAGALAEKGERKGKDEIAFSRHFDSAQRHIARRFRRGNLWWTSNPKEYQNDNKIVRGFVDHYVNLALKKSQTQEKKAEEGHGKEKYVFLEALAEQTQDPVELNAQLLNILLAGRDTTASLLSWLFHELLRHPEIFTKLHQTILETFGAYDNPQEISFTTLKGCQYLQHCLNETLRLWAVVPGNARRSNKATTLPRGGGPDGNSPVYIKPQTDVSYSVHVMHRRKDLWGEDAGEFKPERFQGRRPGWEFLPFNGGPRICIGQQFALTEASYVTVRLLQRFDKIAPAGVHDLKGPVTSNLGLTNCPGKPVTLRLHEAKV